MDTRDNVPYRNQGYNRGRDREYNQHDDDGYRGGYQGGRADFGYRGGRGYRGGGGGRGRYHDDYRGGGGGGGGGGRQNFQDGGRGEFRGGRRDYDNRGQHRGQGNNDWGRSYQYDKSKQSREEQHLPADIKELTKLEGHTKKVEAIAFDATSQQLYTGSTDGTVRSWSAATGQCVSSVEVGGEVDSLLVAGGFLMVGMHDKQEGIIKVWNMSTGASHNLTGHKGQVLAMAVGGSKLFSGGQDTSIRVWAFNASGQVFISEAIINSGQQGHTASITSLIAHEPPGQLPVMFSADRSGCIKVWDLQSMQCVQTVTTAHNLPILSLIIWETFLLSAGLDGQIKCWERVDQPQHKLIIKHEPMFIFTNTSEDDSENRDRRRQRCYGGGSNAPSLPGVLAMHGTLDLQNQPILMVSYNDEKLVRLFELPSFKSRGVLPNVVDSRALSQIPGSIMMAGDKTGAIKVFAWQPAAS